MANFHGFIVPRLIYCQEELTFSVGTRLILPVHISHGDDAVRQLMCRVLWQVTARSLHPDVTSENLGGPGLPDLMKFGDWCFFNYFIMKRFNI